MRISSCALVAASSELASHTPSHCFFSLFLNDRMAHAMSLILAATNGSEIVVGADSLVYEGSGEIYRTYEAPKLRLINGRHWIIAFTGLGNVAKVVWDYFDAKSQTFNPDIRIGVMDCISEMGKVYQQHRLKMDTRAMLAGFSRNAPMIYSWSVNEPSPTGGSLPPWNAIGCGSDVALHLLRISQPLDQLNTEQLVSLVHFSVSEIAKSDVRVGKPIDIGVITPEEATLKTRESLRVFEEKSERLARVLRENL